MHTTANRRCDPNSAVGSPSSDPWTSLTGNPETECSKAGRSCRSPNATKDAQWRNNASVTLESPLLQYRLMGRVGPNPCENVLPSLEPGGAPWESARSREAVDCPDPVEGHHVPEARNDPARCVCAPTWNREAVRPCLNVGIEPAQTLDECRRDRLGRSHCSDVDGGSTTGRDRHNNARTIVRIA
jgi:hypothetical protein